MTTSDAELLLLVDNHVDPSFQGILRPAWGLSVLVNRELLFDLGPSPFVLEHNSRKLGALEMVLSAKYVVISHLHADHIGGLKLLLRDEPRNVGFQTRRIYLLPQSSSYDVLFPDQSLVINRYGSIEIGETYRLLNFETDAGLKEQVLIIETAKGKVVLVGCMHMGLETLLEKIPGKIALLIGGFHTSFLDAEVQKRYLELLETDRILKVAPVHCSGDRFLNLCQERLPDKCLKLGAGSKIYLEG
jgi:7,8-dihydropterin-6-yl-methyl-4-(beta-D-ribofuranosyl)aminobenzene 5'-phosphate synthase